jgi:hypothetical protein
MAGCAVDEQLDPLPSLHLEAPPAPLHGAATIRVEATPTHAFHGVELSLRGARLGVALAPPFDFTFDAATLAEGAATLLATGVLARTGEALTAEAEVVIENGGPALDVVFPRPLDVIRGSPADGFSFAPIVTAADGNGVAHLRAEIQGDMFDLGAGDGAVTLSLLGTGTDFPGPLTEVKLLATDALGATTTRTVQVAASNLALLAPLPDDLGVVDLQALPDGAVIARLAFNVAALLTGSGLAAPLVAVPDGDAGPVARTGEAAFFFRPDATGLRFLRLAGGAPATTLFQLDGATETRAFGPIALASGHVAVGRIDHLTQVTRLAVFAADGSALLDAPLDLPGPVDADWVHEGPDGALLLSPSLSLGLVPVDPATGLVGPVWPSPSTPVERADRECLITLETSALPGQPPSAHLRAFTSLTGPALWDLELPELGNPLPASGCRLLMLTNDLTGAVIQRLGAEGIEAVWSTPPGEIAWLTAPPETPPPTLLVISDSLGGQRLTAIQGDGTEAWTTPLDASIDRTVAVGPDARLLVGHRADHQRVLILAGPDGVRWTAGSTIDLVQDIAASGDDVALTGLTATQTAVVETYTLATGAPGFRYQALAHPGGLAWSGPRGLFLVGGGLDDASLEVPGASQAVLGFRP